MNDYIKLLVWVVVIGASFAFLWRKGYLLRLSNYFLETREELRKCTWPTLDELKGSTWVVMIATLLLVGFTFCSDFVITYLVRKVSLNM